MEDLDANEMEVIRAQAGVHRLGRRERRVAAALAAVIELHRQEWGLTRPEAVDALDCVLETYVGIERRKLAKLQWKGAYV